ncbi:MAG: hypothetical protein V7L29_20215 [Nostoc sp.]|uniref:hypothetical protein n=1 Tax=Nostoc sp. TaxID=1180 RepID=UPI002FF4D98E
MRCNHYISWHHQDGTLNEPTAPAQTEIPATTSNEIMVQIFNECEKYGFEILDDGIYTSDSKLGEVGLSRATWWGLETLERFCPKGTVETSIALSPSLNSPR